ncbi:MAG: PfkB family carbohydrate kinase [Proteobacteria bacterium]|nr:PfkB family carbohydrate kinase [Pseudomonadota bacterium]
MTVAVLGEALIDLIVGDDGAYRPHLGGSPFNVAIGLARQAIGVSYLSPFSDDTFGDRLHDALRREGVETPLARRSLWPTSLALVTIDDKGMPAYRLYRQGVADKDTSTGEIEANLPHDLRVFHTGSLAVTPSQLPKIRKLFELMRARGVTVSMDINIRLRASRDTTAYLDGVRLLLPLADIVKASDEDLEPFRFASGTRKAAAAAYAEMGSGMLVLTEGKGGARLLTASGTLEAKAYPIAHIEDTVGAGDTFHSAFLASLCRSDAIGGPYRDIDPEVLHGAVDFACAAAAINVSRAGCNPPTQAEVESFIAATDR